jgi:uncharacterized protein involved in exopolysaccharide biosynthesis
MQLNQRQEDLREAKVYLVALENEIQARQSLATASGQGAAAPVSEEAMTLMQLKTKLANMQTTYTEMHPDVIRLKSKIAKLEEELAASGSAPAPGAGAAAGGGPSGPSAEVVRQQVQLRGEISSLELEVARIRQQMAEYKRRIEATPKREQELMSLQRDYSNLQSSYNSLLNRKLEAELSVNMEKKQKGEQIQIIDHARTPQKPISPNLQQLFLLTVVAGLGFGCGLIYLLDFMDSSVRRPEAFESKLGIPVMATIPRIYHRRDILRRRFNRLATAGSLLLAVCLLSGFAVLIFNGVEQTLATVRRYVPFEIPFLS